MIKHKIAYIDEESDDIESLQRGCMKYWMY